jgi:putative aminopeptidase FrvX
MATKNTKPAWEKSMPENQFEWMKAILSAPSPIGLEAAMTYGVIKPFFDEIKPKSWAVHQFKGNAGIVLDSHPGEDDRTSVMIIGHADKIRLQVRSIGSDGKIWVNSDSFLPCTLIGHEVKLFSQDPRNLVITASSRGEQSRLWELSISLIQLSAPATKESSLPNSI